MKKIQKHFAAFGIFGLAIGLVVAATQAHATSAASDGETVSAIGSPITPMPSDGVTPPAGTPMPAQVPSAPDDMPAVAPATPPAAPVVEFAKPQPLPPEVAAQQPPQQGLMPGVTTPLPEAATGQSQGGNVMGDTGVQPKHSGTYYDSNAIVPDSALAGAGMTGPRKVDPALEPGQKFIVVEKNKGASSYEAQYTAATRALKLGRYAAAMEMFEKLHNKSPRDPRILMGLAIAQQGAGFNETAIQSYEEVLRLQPNNADAIINLMGITKTQHPAVALTKLKELRNKYPNNPGVPAQLGLVSADMKNYDEAIRYLEIASSMDPRNSSHVYNMAIIQDRKGDAAAAIKLYERALQLDASYSDTATGLPREQIYDRLVILRRKV